MSFLSKKDVFKTISLSFIHISTELSTGNAKYINGAQRFLELGTSSQIDWPINVYCPLEF